MNENQFGELVLIIGDAHIPMRATDIPEKFKELLVPNKVQYVLCTGNIGSKETTDWLKSLSDNFVMVKGDYDDNNNLPENKIIQIGKFKVGVVHGHQIVPWGDDESLGNYARELDVDLLISGHTHQYKMATSAGKFFVNPGSATGAYSPLSTENNPSFILLEILGDNIRAFIYEYKGGKVHITKGSLTDTGEKTE